MYNTHFLICTDMVECRKDKSRRSGGGKLNMMNNASVIVLYLQTTAISLTIIPTENNWNLLKKIEPWPGISGHAVNIVVVFHNVSIFGWDTLVFLTYLYLSNFLGL